MLKSSNTAAAEQPLLVRVKRQREAEPLEQLEMEFDPMTNALKRRKLVTQPEALAKQFEDGFNLESAQMPKENGEKPEYEVTFTLGQSNQVK